MIDIFAHNYLKCLQMSYTKTHLNGYLIQSYYLSDKESDVTLLVNGHRLNAHKFVLSSKSIVFKTMFFGDFREAYAKEVTINDTSVEAFKLLLKYCYFEDLSAADWPPDDHHLVMDVFKLAHIYQLKPLYVICQLKLIGQMSVDNMIDILKLALLYRSKRMAVFAAKFAKVSKEDLIVSKQLLELKDKQIIRFVMRSMPFESQLIPIAPLLAIVHQNEWNFSDLIDCIQIDKIQLEDLVRLLHKDSNAFQEIALKKIENLNEKVAQLEVKIAMNSQTNKLSSDRRTARLTRFRSEQWRDWTNWTD